MNVKIWRKAGLHQKHRPLPKASIWCRRLNCQPGVLRFEGELLGRANKQNPLPNRCSDTCSATVFHYAYFCITECCVECCGTRRACQCMCTQNTWTHICRSALPREARC